MRFHLPAYLTRSTYIIGVFLLIFGIGSCRKAHHPPMARDTVQNMDQTQARESLLYFKPLRALDIVKGLKQDVLVPEVEKALASFFKECSRATQRDIPQIRQAVSLLRKQKNAVQGFINSYNSTPLGDFHARLFILRLLGELQRPDALVFLKSVVWAPLPPETRKSKTDSLSPRDFQQMIQTKAVQCIAFTRNDDGTTSDAAEQEMLEIIRNHSSTYIRICAIDAYMWNHGDTQKAADSLKVLLPANLRKFVGRPRFYRGANRQVFVDQLAEWRKRWASGK